MSGPGWDELPEELRSLISRSLLLRTRVERIDAALLDEDAPDAPESPVNTQLRELAAALRTRQ